MDDLVAELDCLLSDSVITNGDNGDDSDLFPELDDFIVELDCLLSESTIPDENPGIPTEMRIISTNLSDVIDKKTALVNEAPSVITEDSTVSAGNSDIGQHLACRLVNSVTTSERHSVNFDAPLLDSGGQGGHVDTRCVGYVMAALWSNQMEDNHTKGEPPPSSTISPKL
jgi:hypothetical protein